MILGPVGAVVGAVSAKDTRHNVVKEGYKYVNVYHKDIQEKNGVRMRQYICDSDTEVVKLEECLKRVFEVRDDGKKSAQEIPSSGEVYSQLVDLKKLLDAEIITPEEFDKKKKIILGL